MSTTDPSYRHLIQFIPQSSNDGTSASSVSPKDKTEVDVKENGEKVRHFYESLTGASEKQKGYSPPSSLICISDEENGNVHERDANRCRKRRASNSSRRVKNTRCHSSDFEKKEQLSNHSGLRNQSAHGETQSISRQASLQPLSAPSTPSHSSILNPVERKHFKLLQAAQLNDTKQLASLLKDGLDVNFKDFYGWTALMCAAKEGHGDAVLYLLNHRADRAITNNEGETATMIAFSAGHEALGMEIKQFSTTKQARQGQVQKNESFSSTFYCQNCKANFSLSEQKSHVTSTIHLFNSGHTAAGPSYLIPETNRGFQMLLRGGWNSNQGLGRCGEGHKYPVKTVLKRDRLGLGCDDKEKKKAQVTHFNSNDKMAIGRPEISHRQISARKAAQQVLKYKERKSRRLERNLRFEFSDFN